MRADAVHPRSRHTCPRGLSRRSSRGVSLIELMVGLAIGLLAVLVIAQVALVYEGRKRTVTATSDAQVQGALALQTLQRDVQAGGYGMTEGGSIGCRIEGLRADTPDAERFVRTLTPVVVIDGADGRPDSLEVLMSGHGDFALPIRVASNHTRGAQSFVISANDNLGLRRGNLMLAVPVPTPEPDDGQRWCSLFNLSSDPVPGSGELPHATGDAGPWNHDLTTSVFPGHLSTDLSYPAGSHLLSLGRLVSRRYCISGLGDAQCDNRSGDGSQRPTVALNLRQVSFDTDTGRYTAEDLFPQIVSLQAVYGHDTSTPADHIADVWNAVPPRTGDAWRRVVAVRIALVARSANNDSRPDQGVTAVTATLPVWHPDGTTAEPIDVRTVIGDDWQQYRYKVYEAVIPLRNVLWQPT